MEKSGISQIDTLRECMTTMEKQLDAMEVALKLNEDKIQEIEVRLYKLEGNFVDSCKDTGNCPKSSTGEHWFVDRENERICFYCDGSE